LPFGRLFYLIRRVSILFCIIRAAKKSPQEFARLRNITSYAIALSLMPVACRLHKPRGLLHLNNCHHFYSSCILGSYPTETFSKLAVFLIHPTAHPLTGSFYGPVRTHAMKWYTLFNIILLTERKSVQELLEHRALENIRIRHLLP
jgi:hypothetical protein